MTHRQPDEEPTDGAHRAPPTAGGALFAPPPMQPADGAAAQAGQRGVLGARPVTDAAPAGPAEAARTGSGLLSSQAAAPPLTHTQAAPVAEAQSTAVDRAHATQLAQAAAARRALAQAAPASLPHTVPAWSNWQTSALAVAPELSPPPGQPSRPYTPIRPATAWRIHAVQVVAWQLAVVGAVIAPRLDLAGMIGVLVGVVVLLALSVPWWHGRWAYQWLGIWLRFCVRRRHRVMQAGSPIDELLHSLLRGPRVSTVEVDDAERAILSHAGGLTALVEALPLRNAIVVDSGVAVPSPLTLLPTADETRATISAQVIVQTTPAPGGYRSEGIVAHSYRALGQGMVPAHRRSWIALQVMRSAQDSGADDTDLRAALTNAIARLERQLRRAGMRTVVLDRTALTADLATLSGAETVPDEDGTASVRVRERWGSWSVGSHAQVAYRLQSWPNLGTHTGRMFLDRLATLPSVTTTVGLAARHVSGAPKRSVTGDEVELEAVLRMTVPHEGIEELQSRLAELTTQHDVRLQRMDGEHAFGMAASLPLGGFVS